MDCEQNDKQDYLARYEEFHAAFETLRHIAIEANLPAHSQEEISLPTLWLAVARPVMRRTRPLSNWLAIHIYSADATASGIFMPTH